MKISRRIPVLVTLVGAAFGVLSLHGRPAHAQINPDVKSYGVYETPAGGTPTLVGEIYREDTDRTHYTEHWVLYPAYLNPSEANGLTVTIRPGLNFYRDTNDFFARVRWSTGSRYVASPCTDGDALPVRR